MSQYKSLWWCWQFVLRWILALFHGSAYRRILRLRSGSPAYVYVPNFCGSLINVECLVMWSTHRQKPTFAANLWNTLAMSTEFPTCVTADSVLTVSRAMKLGFYFFMKSSQGQCSTNVRYHSPVAVAVAWPDVEPSASAESAGSSFWTRCLGWSVPSWECSPVDPQWDPSGLRSIRWSTHWPWYPWPLPRWSAAG